MRKISKTALWGAVIGFVFVTVFAVGEMLGDAEREGVPLPVTLILAMAMGGLLIGAPFGAVVGGLVGWARGRADSSAPTPVDSPPSTTPSPVSYGPRAQQPQTAPPPAPAAEAAPVERIDPDPQPAPERPALDRDALIRSTNQLRTKMTEENERRRPRNCSRRSSLRRAPSLARGSI